MFTNSCRITCVFPSVLIFLVKMIKKKIFKSGKITCVFPFVMIFLVKMIKRKNVTPIKRTRVSSYFKGRVWGEFWWWTRSEISKKHRLSWLPSASTRRLARLPWNFVPSFRKHCCTKGCPRFLYLLVVPNKYMIHSNSFLWKVYKN